jgi:large subunit ribosomal protein L23
MKTDLTSILIRPRITEKATLVSESSVYVFEVSPKAAKREIEKAFVEKYKAVPVKVTTITVPAKKVVVRGKRGVKAGFKKAYVYLKKGEKVEII